MKFTTKPIQQEAKEFRDEFDNMLASEEMLSLKESLADDLRVINDLSSIIDNTNTAIKVLETNGSSSVEMLNYDQALESLLQVPEKMITVGKATEGLGASAKDALAKFIDFVKRIIAKIMNWMRYKWNKVSHKHPLSQDTIKTAIKMVNAVSEDDLQNTLKSKNYNNAVIVQSENSQKMYVEWTREAVEMMQKTTDLFFGIDFAKFDVTTDTSHDAANDLYALVKRASKEVDAMKQRFYTPSKEFREAMTSGPESKKDVSKSTLVNALDMYMERAKIVARLREITKVTLEYMDKQLNLATRELSKYFNAEKATIQGTMLSAVKEMCHIASSITETNIEGATRFYLPGIEWENERDDEAHWDYVVTFVMRVLGTKY